MNVTSASIIKLGKTHFIISLYGDDLLIFGSNLHVINGTKTIIRSHFDMKNLGEANFILGMKITKTCDGIYLEQSYYIEKILKKYNYHVANMLLLLLILVFICFLLIMTKMLLIKRNMLA